MTRVRPTPTLDEAAIERFWKYVDKKGADECWNWTGARSGRMGYGCFNALGTQWKANRISWRVHHGECPGELFVCHKCDNPLCVNPDHLFLGTNADNVKDSIAKGRQYPPHRSRMYCKRGHRFTKENSGKNTPGRYCKKCQAEGDRRRYLKRKAEQANQQKGNG